MTELIYGILLQEKKVVPTVVLSSFCFFLFFSEFVCVVFGCVGWPMPPGGVVLVFCVLLLFVFFCHTITVTLSLHNNSAFKALQICQPQRQVRLEKPTIHILMQCHCKEWTTVKSLNECVKGYNRAIDNASGVPPSVCTSSKAKPNFQLCPKYSQPFARVQPCFGLDFILIIRKQKILFNLSNIF